MNRLPKLNQISVLVCAIAVPAGSVLAQKKTTSPSSSFRAPSISISSWTRGAGNYEMGNDIKAKDEAKISWDGAKMSSETLYDVQYQDSYTYSGQYLNAGLIEAMPKGADAVILHFSNQIQIALKRAEIAKGIAQKDHGIFLAVAVKDPKDKKSEFSSQFEAVSRKDERFRDPRPIRFDQHKVVVGIEVAGGSKAKDQQHFSPWKHVSSLSGIEWIRWNPYYAQFDVDAGKTRRGLSVFINRCSYCHSVKMVGARFGWDFVDPLPIFEKRNVDSLFAHVKHPKGNPIQMGMHMPHQPDVNRQEAEQLWEWLRAVAKLKLKPYQP